LNGFDMRYFALSLNSLRLVGVVFHSLCSAHIRISVQIYKK
jgi:hypothetical protein